jgi:AraC family transcriptional regulator
MSDSKSPFTAEPGSYGKTIGLHFGLKEPPPGIIANDLGRMSLAVTRLRSGAGRVATRPLPSEAAVLVVIYLAEVPGLQLSLEGRPLGPPRALAAGTVQVVDLRCNSAWFVDGPFDCLHLYVPHEALERLIAEHGWGRPGNLARLPLVETDDSVLRHLGSSFLLALEHPRETSRPFVEHLALALQTHLARSYYGIALTHDAVETRGRVSWQEQTAINAMPDDMSCGFELAEVATKCRMSVKRFRREFRRHTGQTPHGWLTHRRIARARDLLQTDDLPLSEIALRCGFSDQSHFTRVFAQVTGRTPGAWRRATC